MKIEWTSRSLTGTYDFVASPGEYDGVPATDTLSTDRGPLIIQDDVLALAGFLAFAPYCSGPITLPRSVSPELARAMEAFLDPVWIQVSPLEVEARKAPQGEGFAFLSTIAGTDPLLPNAWGQPRNVTFRVLDSSRWNGSLVTTDQLIVGSNAGILGRLGPRKFARLPSISTALLFMESFRCSTLVVPDDFVTDGDLWNRLGSLIHACKYALLRESEALELFRGRAEGWRLGGGS